MPRTLGIHHDELALAHDLLTKRGRERHRCFLLEGPTLLAEAIASGAHIEAVYVTREAYEELRGELGHALEDGMIAIVAEQSIKRLSSLTTPRGVITVVTQREHELARVMVHDSILLLAGLNDPGNVGTLLRSADAFGFVGVLLIEGGAELYNPKIVRATMGAIFRLDIASVSLATLTSAIAGRPLIAGAASGESLDTFLFPPRAIVAIGHERRGLSAEGLASTATVAIPQLGQAESLNAAVAGSIIMYCSAKQKRLSSLG